MIFQGWLVRGVSGEGSRMVTAVEFGKTLPFAHAAQLYLDAGWSPLPLFPGPKKKKGIPPAGFTGSAGRMATQEDVDRWLATDAGRPIAVRLPGTVIGIDVDAYVPKNGGERLRALEAELGELPPSWKSTARLDGVSGIRFYQVPEGRRFAADLGGDIELICRGYRFARVWPSSHPDGGTYQWFAPGGEMVDGPVPRVADLPQLPFTWLQKCMDGPQGEDEADTGAWTSSGRYSKPDIERLRLHGIPADAYHDNVLKDVAWELRVLGFSGEEAHRLWAEIVAKTPAKDLSNPFTDDDFWKRHWKGAVRKIPDSQVVTEAQRSWAVELSANGKAAATEAEEVTKSDSEAAAGEEAVSDAEQVLALTQALIRRGGDGNIDLGATHEDLPRSDMSSADLILRLWPGRFTFSTQSSMWRIWDGKVHVRAEDGNVNHVVRQFARSYKQAMRLIRERAITTAIFEGSTPQEAEEAYERMWKKHRTYRDAIWMNPGQAKIVKQLSEHVSVSEEKFDDPAEYSKLVVAENGVISITENDAVLLPHNPERYVTLSCGKGVEYSSAAAAPVFTRFLITSIPDDEQRLWLQKTMGLSLIGQPGKTFINLIGKTNSGKSTLIRALQKVLGGYGRAVSIETFLEGQGSSEFRLHELKGARVVFATEPAANRRLNTEVIKAVTGGDEQRTREPYGKFVTWKPQCLIIIASNQPQKFETSDTAMLNRIGPVAFSQNHVMDPRLDEKLALELPGILAWLVEGAKLGMANAPEMPESALSLRELMADAVDDSLRFITEALMSGWLLEDASASASVCVTAAETYQLFLAWAASEGIQQRFLPGRKQFTGRIGRRYPVVRSNGSRLKGLRLPVG